MSHPIVSVMDVAVHDLDFEQTLELIREAALAQTTLVVATPNVDYVVRAHRDKVFRDAINAADLRVPDGMWIVRATRLAGTPLRGTVTGRLLLPALAGFAAEHRLAVALVGAPPGVASRAGQRLTERHPGLRIAIATAPPMGFDVGDEDDGEMTRRIAETDARLVFVALGAPRQERWMAAHRADLSGRVLIGIGAGLDIVAGRFKEAPKWMTSAGLEWAFRLAQEPRRLARRYLVDDPTIFAWALRQRLRSRT